MAASSRTEPIGEVKEVLFVDGLEDFGYPGLHYLVFVSGYSGLAKVSAIDLWNVRPAYWLRPITVCFQPCDKVPNVDFEIFLIFMLCDRSIPVALLPSSSLWHTSERER